MGLGIAQGDWNENFQKKKKREQRRNVERHRIY
jgi:hypothetical protein